MKRKFLNKCFRESSHTHSQLSQLAVNRRTVFIPILIMVILLLNRSSFAATNSGFTAGCSDEYQTCFQVCSIVQIAFETSACGCTIDLDEEGNGGVPFPDWCPGWVPGDDGEYHPQPPDSWHQYEDPDMAATQLCFSNNERNWQSCVGTSSPMNDNLNCNNDVPIHERSPDNPNCTPIGGNNCVQHYQDCMNQANQSSPSNNISPQ